MKRLMCREKLFSSVPQVLCILLVINAVVLSLSDNANETAER